MLITLAQLNPIIGDLNYNSQKIIDAILKAKEDKSTLILFPELSLSGYPPEDLLLHPEFLKKSEEYLKKIVKETKDIIAIVGTIRQNTSSSGKPLYNSAAIIKDGEILGYQDKVLLPTYDIFDEQRYFEAGDELKLWDLAGKKVGITICEDIWYHPNLKEAFFDTKYHKSPVDELTALKPDVVLNLSSSPYSTSQLKDRLAVCSYAAKAIKAPLFYCNQVGANDSLIFDGRSMVLNSSGEVVLSLKSFQEGLVTIDLNTKFKPEVIQENVYQDLFDALVTGVYDYFHKSGFKKAILGLSGGIDSALVACITVKALGSENVRLVAMPSRYSSKESIIDAKLLSQNLHCKLEEISIESVFTSYLNLLEPHFFNKSVDITEENMQARIRGMILMALSNKFGNIVLSCGNKSEMALGYCTLYGDMCGGLSMIGDVTKTEVYQLCKWINREKEIIPKNILVKAPSAELRFNQKDQDTLPEYDIIDIVLKAHMEELLSNDEIAKKYNLDLALVDDLIFKICKNEFKRSQAPLTLRVSKRSFAVGRRFPIVQNFNWN